MAKLDKDRNSIKLGDRTSQFAPCPAGHVNIKTLSPELVEQVENRLNETEPLQALF